MENLRKPEARKSSIPDEDVVRFEGAPLPLSKRNGHCLNHGQSPANNAGGHHLSHTQQEEEQACKAPGQAAGQGATTETGTSSTQGGGSGHFGPQPFCSRHSKLEPKFLHNGKVYIFNDKTPSLTGKNAGHSELLSEEQALRKCMLYRCV